MSTVNSECCCLLSILRQRKDNRSSRRASLSEDSLILPYPRARPRRAGQRPRCCLVKQQLPEGVASWSSQEAIELKCYSLSKDRVVVSLDKRCCLLTPPNGLTRTRPFSCMEDGRRHLDTRRRPDSVSLIKLCVDPESGKLQRSLSIHEIDSDNEFEECKQVANSERATHSPLDHDTLAKRLSQRSLVIVERNVPTKRPHDHDSSSSLMLDIPEVEGGGGGEPATEFADEMQQNSLERDFVESLSLGAGDEFLYEQNQHREDEDNSYEHVHEHDCQHHQQQQQVLNERKLETFKPTTATSKRRKPLKLAKRLFRWMGATTKKGAESASETDDTPTSTPRGSRDTPEVSHTEQTSENDRVTNAVRTTNQTGQLVALGRPESIFLWPQRLSDAYATTLTGGSLTSSLAAARRPRRPPASVMISYNHMEAKEYAISLHAALETQGVSAYLDLYDIQKGEDWQDSLNFAILDCRLFVPLVTPSYGETLWTSRECKLADVLAKRIVPINFGQRWPPPSLAIQFATLQYVDWLHHEVASVLDPHMMDEGGAGWPRECVHAIARQLKARLQSDLLHAAVAAAASTSGCFDDSGISTSGGGATAELQSAPPPLVELEEGVSTRKFVSNDKRRRQQQVTRERMMNLNMRTTLHASSSLDTASTTTSSCHTTSSNSPSCYDSMAESSRSAATAYSPPGGSPTLLEELADSSNFVLVPPVSARAGAAADAPTQPPAASPPKQRRKRSLGQRTKKVLTRLRSSLAPVRSGAGA